MVAIVISITIAKVRNIFETTKCFRNYFRIIFVNCAHNYPEFSWKFQKKWLYLQSIKVMIMSKKEKEEKAKEFWEYYEATQGTITITDPVVLD